MAAVVNIHGRRGGRGLRPWLIVAKILAICVYFGSLSAVLVVWFSSGFGALDKSDPLRLHILSQVRALIVYLMLPSLLLTLVLGFALLMQFPRGFLRMRWLLLKLFLLAMLVPASHLFCRSRLRAIRAAYSAGIVNVTAERQFPIGIAAALGGSALVIALGRVKPRLGQNWARTFNAITPSSSADRAIGS